MPVKRGIEHHGAKLTDEAVGQIKRESLIVDNERGRPPTQRELGDKYGVSHVAIHKILAGKSWMHVEAATHG